MTTATTPESLIDVSSLFRPAVQASLPNAEVPLEALDARSLPPGYFALVVPESEAPYARFFQDINGLARFARSMCGKPAYLIAGYGNLIPYTQAPLRLFVLPDSRCVQFYPTPGVEFQASVSSALAIQTNNYVGEEFKIRPNQEE